VASAGSNEWRVYFAPDQKGALVGHSQQRVVCANRLVSPSVLFYRVGVGPTCAIPLQERARNSWLWLCSCGLRASAPDRNRTCDLQLKNPQLGKTAIPRPIATQFQLTYPHCPSRPRAAFAVRSVCLRSAFTRGYPAAGFTWVRASASADFRPRLALTRRNPVVPCRCDKRYSGMSFFGNWL
jgi:hypothetical protein